MNDYENTLEIDRHRKELINARKQGAIQELNLLINFIDKDYEDNSWVKKYCVKRLKDLQSDVL